MTNKSMILVQREEIERYCEDNFIELDHLVDFLAGQMATFKLVNDEHGNKILRINVKLYEQ